MGFGGAGGNGAGVQQRMANTPLAVDELVTESAAVAQEVAVDLVVVAGQDAPEHSVPFAGVGVTADAAVDADRRRKLQVPLAGVMALQRLVREHAGRADLDEVPAEFAFQEAVLVTAEEDDIARREGVQVGPARVLAIEAHAAVALDTAVHLVIDEGPQVLITKRTFVEFVLTATVPGHDRHVLEVTLAAFIAHWAVMRMVQHEPFDDPRAERRRFRIGDGDA